MQRKFFQRFVIRFVEITNTAAATRVSTANTVEVGAVSVAHRYVKTIDASRLTTMRSEIVFNDSLFMNSSNVGITLLRLFPA